MPTRSILPNTSARILQRMQGKYGTFHVKWNAERDSHVLYFNDMEIASHHNGFSCHALAERILLVWHGKREWQYAFDQFDYILKCGGTGAARETVEWVIAGSEDQRSLLDTCKRLMKA